MKERTRFVPTTKPPLSDNAAQAYQRRVRDVASFDVCLVPPILMLAMASALGFSRVGEAPRREGIVSEVENAVTALS
ncbi:hypothetical protein A5669_21925 [Mycolicibacterium fortuitum]|nr:hypothetical protein A5669_21925 [Mycolicibacterium fortuitum]